MPSFLPSFHPIKLGRDARIGLHAVLETPPVRVLGQAHSPIKPVLVFVSSRRQTRLTALDLIGYAAGDERPRQFVHCPEPELEQAVAAVQVGAKIGAFVLLVHVGGPAQCVSMGRVLGGSWGAVTGMRSASPGAAWHSGLSQNLHLDTEGGPPPVCHDADFFLQDAQLRHTLQFGIGLHHAGLNEGDRSTVEHLFVAGKIQVGHLVLLAFATAFIPGIWKAETCKLRLPM